MGLGLAIEAWRAHLWRGPLMPGMAQEGEAAFPSRSNQECDLKKTAGLSMYTH